MNTQTYLTLLGSRLFTQTGASLTQTQLTYLMADAVRAYSRFRKAKRRFGEGILAIDAPNPASPQTVTVAGGYFSPGQTLLFDAFTPFQESATVESIARIAPDQQQLLVGTGYTLTVTGLTKPHYAGELISSPTVGLNVTQGEAQYSMPFDWIKAEENTFQVAIGQKQVGKKVESFYDDAYYYSQLLSGVGYGQAQTFSSQGLYQVGGAFVGIPNAPNAFVVPFQGGCATQYQFSDGEPVVLTIDPVPAANATLQFYYWALQQPQTVPDAQMDALLDYGMYIGLTAAASGWGSLPESHDIDQGISTSASASALAKLAAQSLASFKEKIVQRPFFILG